MKRWIALILSMALIFTTLPVFTEKAPAERQTDIRLSFSRERQIRQEAGMDLAQWDEAVAAARQAGLADPISREAMLAADAGAVILEDNGTTYQLGTSSLFGPVNSAEDAYRLAYRLAETLGGSALTELVLSYRLGMNGKTVYSFQQVCDGRETMGGSLKIALDGNNQVTAVFASIDPEDSREQKTITREEAEAEAAAHASGEALTEYTDRDFVSPLTLERAMNLDVDQDPIPNDLAWIVYTAAAENAEEYPYTAHYIKLDGTYLRSLPVREPGDEESRRGYRKEDIFTGMTPDTYTGELTDVHGNVRTVTVPVMRSEADGCWYLGDAERRIAFADYYERAYGENHELALIKSEDNRSWENGDIYTFLNYLKTWQFYADMGWNGPDGEGTDVIILKDMCYSDRKSYENACCLGLIGCWQYFGYDTFYNNGAEMRVTWGLDVMGHEFTHTFTGTLMNQNLYENDQGAINEAMSDILGNLIEYICEDTDDTQWMLGENTDSIIRNMSSPEAFIQPRSVWGKYYGPQTDTPNTANDRGGVHSNSSMLNLIAYSLCVEYGMSYEEAVRLWVTTAAGMTSKTDYIQMSTLLPWALEEAGESDRYRDALSRLTEETRIGSAEMPETLPEGQKLVLLTLPDTPAFRENKEWFMIINQMDIRTQEELRDAFIKTVTEMAGSAESRRKFTEGLRTLLGNLRIRTSELGGPTFEIDREKVLTIENDLLNKLADLFSKAKKGVVAGETSAYSWENRNTGVIPAVVDDKPTEYMLLNVSRGGSKIEKMVYLLGGSWYDLTDFMLNDAYNKDETAREKLIKIAKEIGKQGLRNLIGALKNGTGTGGRSEAGAITTEELPSTGLEYIVLDGQE